MRNVSALLGGYRHTGWERFPLCASETAAGQTSLGRGRYRDNVTVRSLPLPAALSALCSDTELLLCTCCQTRCRKTTELLLAVPGANGHVEPACLIPDFWELFSASACSHVLF